MTNIFRWFSLFLWLAWNTFLFPTQASRAIRWSNESPLWRRVTSEHCGVSISHWTGRPSHRLLYHCSLCKSWIYDYTHCDEWHESWRSVERLHDCLGRESLRSDRLHCFYTIVKQWETKGPPSLNLLQRDVSPENNRWNHRNVSIQWRRKRSSLQQFKWLYFCFGLSY